MPALHNRERDTADYRDQRRDQSGDDREISLGTGTILAIFFALALVCAVFFGLGYSMGRKSAQPTTVAAAIEPAVSNASLGNVKPSAGNPAGGSSAQTSSTFKRSLEAAAQLPKDPDAEIVTTPVTHSEESSVAPRAISQVRKAAPQDTSAAPTIREEPRNAPVASQPSMPITSTNGTSIVQVAAVSHQEDADVLLSALKKRGYNVFIRQEPQDHLLHVQIGPFTTKKDAEIMRQRLLSDGYNAIVK